MKVIVLGAGVIGVTSAWYLAQAGHEVTVVERQPGPGLETSFANGGQISVSHAEPWANPRAPWQILKWLLRDDAPLLFRPHADAAQWRWIMQFLRECLPTRTRANTLAIFQLAQESRAALHALRAETGIAYDAQTRGILRIYTDRREFDAACTNTELLRSHGCVLDIKSAEECVALEPALRDATLPLAGGIHAPQDESGDACRFTQALAGLCAQRGVAFHYDTHVEALEAQAGCVSGVRIVNTAGQQGTLRADVYVVALGSYSPLLRGLGARLLVYPVKGYSVTLPASQGTPHLSLTDEAHKIVISRLGERLRVAGTAELAGHDPTLNPLRCQAILKRALELFPHAGDTAQAEFWAGLRPATPSNIPIIGKMKFENIFLNTGHGTLGWTLACGSGKRLAEMVGG